MRSVSRMVASSKGSLFVSSNIMAKNAVLLRKVLKLFPVQSFTVYQSAPRKTRRTLGSNPHDFRVSRKIHQCPCTASGAGVLNMENLVLSKRSRKTHLRRFLWVFRPYMIGSTMLPPCRSLSDSYCLMTLTQKYP